MYKIDHITFPSSHGFELHLVDDTRFLNQGYAIEWLGLPFHLVLSCFPKRVLQSYNKLGLVFSVTMISPVVSLKFELYGDASFVIKPKDYLEHNGPQVSYPTSFIVKSYFVLNYCIKHGFYGFLLNCVIISNGSLSWYKVLVMKRGALRLRRVHLGL